MLNLIDRPELRTDLIVNPPRDCYPKLPVLWRTDYKGPKLPFKVL